MLFAMICTDKANALEIRMATRSKHLEYLEGLGAQLKAAGPFLDANAKPNGSLVIIEAADQIQAETIASQDPYALAGLFDSVEIRPWNWVLKNPEA